MNTRITRLFISVAASAVLLAGCGAGKDNKSSETPAQSVSESASASQSESASASSGDKVEQKKLRVYASTDPIYDFAKIIGGDHIDLHDLMPGQVDAHHWEPTPKDIAALNESDLLLINGANFEMWLDGTKDSLGKNLQIVNTGEKVDLIKVDHADEDHDHDHEHADGDHEHKDGDHEHSDADHDHKDGDHEHKDADHEHKDGDHDHEHADADHDHDHEHAHGHFHGGVDPHYWLDPAEALKQAEAIYEALAKADPANAETYKKNFEGLKAQLVQLDEDYKKELAPYKGRAILVPHEAFGYLCRAFDLKQIGIEGLLADGDPSAARLKEIIDTAKKDGIKVVFYEAGEDSKIAEQIAKEIGAKVMPFNTLESITDEQRAKGENYITIMRANLEALLASFGAEK